LTEKNSPAIDAFDESLNIIILFLSKGRCRGYDNSKFAHSKFTHCRLFWLCFLTFLLPIKAIKAWWNQNQLYVPAGSLLFVIYRVQPAVS